MGGCRDHRGLGPSLPGGHGGGLHAASARGGARSRALTAPPIGDLVRLARIIPGRTPRADLAGAILARDLPVAGHRLPKGSRLTPEHLEAIGAEPLGRPVTVLLP